MRSGIVLAWILSLVLTWYVTISSVEPEKIIVKQDRIIYKLKKDIEVKDIKENSRYIIRVPFTKIGLTKNFTLGTITGYILAAL